VICGEFEHASYLWQFSVRGLVSVWCWRVDMELMKPTEKARGLSQIFCDLLKMTPT